MAYDSNEQFVENDGKGSSPRAQGLLKAATLAGGTGEIAALTPMAFNTSTEHWVVWDADGSNGTNSIKAFMGPDGHTLVSGAETIAQLYFDGVIHRDDIPIVAANYNQSQLDAALASTVRSLGFNIQGIADFR